LTDKAYRRNNAAVCWKKGTNKNPCLSRGGAVPSLSNRPGETRRSDPDFIENGHQTLRINPFTFRRPSDTSPGKGGKSITPGIGEAGAKPQASALAVKREGVVSSCYPPREELAST